MPGKEPEANDAGGCPGPARGDQHDPGCIGLSDAAHHFHQDQFREGRINFLLTDILYANAITTVSPTIGVTSLYAALEVTTGRVVGECTPRHTGADFLRFLKRVAWAYRGQALHTDVAGPGDSESPPRRERRIGLAVRA